MLVQGIGGIGAFLTYVLAQSGADVIALDRDRDRLAIATELGARKTVLATESGAGMAISSAVGDRDLRVVFEVTGSRSGIESALHVAPRGCRIVLVGIQKQPVPVDLGLVTLEERMLIGANALVREIDFPRAVELVARRRGGWATIAPIVLPLDDLVEGALLPMSEGRGGAIKTLIDPRATEPRPLRALS